MNKRGSHVGIIASFAIFILFLVGMYVVFQPVLATKKDKQNLMNYLEESLIQELSENITRVTFSPSAGNCTFIDNSALGLLGLDFIARDQNGIIPSSLQGQNTLVQATASQIAWVYYADVNFSNNPTADSGCGAVIIGAVTSSKKVFEENVFNAANNFQQFSSNLNIPPGSNMGFYFVMNNGSEIKVNDVQISQDIFSKEIPIQYINSNAEELSGKIVIRVW